MDDDDLRDLFASVGPISLRRMFGGKGVYRDGMIFAVVMRDELLLKGDDLTAADLEAAGARRWIYEGKSGAVAMPYWTTPETALDDPDEMARWARLAVEAARRADAGKKPASRPKPDQPKAGPQRRRKA